MTLTAEYRRAQQDEETTRLRRIIALRGMVAMGMSQNEIAGALGISQSAVSQQLKSASTITDIHPRTLLEAAGPILTCVAEEHGYSRLAVFGSVARRQARPDSDIDLLVEAAPGTSSFAFVRFKQLIQQILGREIDLLPYGGLTSKLDADIRREAVPL